MGSRPLPSTGSTAWYLEWDYWTRKSRGKTVGLMLTADELPLYREWIENNRNLERVLREMRTVSTRALALTTGRKAP